MLLGVHWFPQTDTTSVYLTAVRGIERLHHSPAPYVCMTNEVNQEGSGATHVERLRQKTKSLLF